MTQEELAPDISWAECSPAKPAAFSAPIIQNTRQDCGEVHGLIVPKIKFLQRAFPSQAKTDSILAVDRIPELKFESDVDEVAHPSTGDAYSPSTTPPSSRKTVGNITTSKEEQYLIRSFIASTSRVSHVAGQSSPISALSPVNTARTPVPVDGLPTTSQTQKITPKLLADSHLAPSTGSDDAARVDLGDEAHLLRSAEGGDGTPPMPPSPIHSQSLTQELLETSESCTLPSSSSGKLCIESDISLPDSGTVIKAAFGSADLGQNGPRILPPVTVIEVMVRQHIIEDAIIVPVGLTGSSDEASKRKSNSSLSSATAGQQPTVPLVGASVEGSSTDLSTLSPDFYIAIDEMARRERERRLALKQPPITTTMSQYPPSTLPRAQPSSHTSMSRSALGSRDPSSIVTYPLPSMTMNPQVLQDNRISIFRQHSQGQLRPSASLATQTTSLNLNSQKFLNSDLQGNRESSSMRDYPISNINTPSTSLMTVLQKPAYPTTNSSQIHVGTTDDSRPATSLISSTPTGERPEQSRSYGAAVASEEYASTSGVESDTWSELELQAIEEMERVALLKLKKKQPNSQPPHATPSTGPVHLSPPPDTDSARIDSILPSPSVSLPMLTVSSAPAPVRCVRLVALDVFEDVHRRAKEVRCVRPQETRLKPVTGGGGLDSSLGHVMSIWLTGDWATTDIYGGDVFHLLYFGEKDLKSRPDSACSGSVDRQSHEVMESVSNDFGLIVVHPDTLVSPTRIVEALGCARRGVLSDRVRSLSGTGISAVMGNLKHTFVEGLIDLVVTKIRTCGKNNNAEALYPSDTELSRLITEAVKENLNDLWAIRARDSEVSSSLRAMVKPVVHWLLSGSLASADSGSGLGARSHSNLANSSGCIESVLGVEQTLWSPALGVKGQLDLVVARHGLAFPVEIKTGKRHPNSLVVHRAQVMLYMLMMLLRGKSSPLSFKPSGSAVHPMNKDSQLNLAGLLIYVSDDNVHCDVIEPNWTELRALVLARNRLSVLLKTAAEVTVRPLPAVIRNRAECEGCFRASECMGYHAALEGGSAVSSGIPPLFKYAMRGVTASQLAYVRHWDRLLDLEALAEADSRPQSQWHLSGSAVESAGSPCIAGLKLVSALAKPDSNGIVILLRKNYKKIMQAFNSDLEVGDSVADDDTVAVPGLRPGLSVGDRVSLSVEWERDFLLASVHGSSIDLEDLLMDTASTAVEPNICPGTLLSASAEEYRVEVSRFPRRIASLLASNGGNDSHAVSLRLDKDVSFDNIATLRMNIWSLVMVSHDPKNYSEWIRTHSSQGQEPTPNTQKGTVSTQIQTGAPPVSGWVDKHASATKRRVRDLIVDLAPPDFAQVTDIDIYILAPAGFTIAAYEDALSHIDRYMQLNSTAAVASSNRASTGSSQLEVLTDAAGRVPVVRGPFGVLSVLGGLHVLPGCNPRELWRELDAMNSGQRAALMRLLTARDYVLFLGMPGTGKTSTLSLAVRCLLARGLRVLVTAYTHAAVDNLLLKLKEAGLSPGLVLRLGSVASIHVSLHDFALSDTIESLAAYSHRLAGVRLVVCTALAASRSPVVSKIPFDWCVMDEAGQITQPAALGPIMTARRFVLVGDDYQLPPLVLSPEAKAGGMDVSLFKRLAEAHPHAVSTLSAQYRMNEDLQSLCNTLIYDHRLQCATPAVANRRLNLPTLHLLPRPVMVSSSQNRADSGRSDWLYNCIAPANPVVFIDTDLYFNEPPSSSGALTRPYVLRELEASEANVRKERPTVSIHSGEGCKHDTTIVSRGVDLSHVPKSTPGQRVSRGVGINQAEAEVVCLVARALKASGLSPLSLGLLSPYRGQVTCIRALLAMESAGKGSDEAGDSDAWEGLQVSTVDQFQGRDVEALVVSTVRSISDQSAGDLLRDWRRVNVALTRARSKLVVIGSLAQLSTVPVTAGLCRFVQAKGWVLTLPRAALTMYPALLPERRGKELTPVCKTQVVTRPDLEPPTSLPRVLSAAGPPAPDAHRTGTASTSVQLRSMR